MKYKNFCSSKNIIKREERQKDNTYRVTTHIIHNRFITKL